MNPGVSIQLFTLVWLLCMIYYFTKMFYGFLWICNGFNIIILIKNTKWWLNSLWLLEWQSLSNLLDNIPKPFTNPTPILWVKMLCNLDIPLLLYCLQLCPLWGDWCLGGVNVTIKITDIMQLLEFLVMEFLNIPPPEKIPFVKKDKWNFN